MHKFLLLLILLSIDLFAIKDLEPNKVIEATGSVQTLVFNDNKLYAGTDNGTVEIFDNSNFKKLKTIKIDKIKDFMGDLVKAKIYSIDVLNNKIVIASQGEQAYRNIFIYDNSKLKKIIGIENQYMIQEVKFVSDNLIIIGLLSNQIALYDLNKKKLIYLTQMSYSSFSDFSINEDKTKLASTDESGIVRLFDIKNGQIIKQLDGINLDRVYQVDYKKNIVLTAGKDRKAVVFKEYSNYSLNFDFFLYSCALSPSGKLGAIAYNEKNEILIFDINTKKYLYNLKGQIGTINQILFINENEIFISSGSEKINYFNLKGK